MLRNSLTRLEGEQSTRHAEAGNSIDSAKEESKSRWKKTKRIGKANADAGRVPATRLKEEPECSSGSLTKKRSRLSAASKPSATWILWGLSDCKSPIFTIPSTKALKNSF